MPYILQHAESGLFVALGRPRAYTIEIDLAQPFDTYEEAEIGRGADAERILFYRPQTSGLAADLWIADRPKV